MSIYRIVKDKENPYVMVNKGWVYDKRLSAKSKGVLLYLLSRPDDWKVYENEIMQNFSDGRDSIRSALKELIKFGYINREKIRDSKGKLNGYNYEVYEVSSIDGKSNNGLSDNGKPTTTNKELTNKELNNYKKDNGIPSGNTSLSLFQNKDIVNAISYYMNNLYKQKTKRKHPFLKADQYKTVYESMNSVYSEWGLDYDNLVDMMVQFLNSNIKSDWNINNFATEGILVNRMYEVAY